MIFGKLNFNELSIDQVCIQSSIVVILKQSRFDS